MTNRIVFADNIEKITLDNEYYRKVLYTTDNMQLVVMTIKPGEDIELELHDNTDQFIRVEKGEGRLLIGTSNIESYHLEDGVAVIIPKGTYHRVVNTSDKSKLKLYSIYTPPEHDVNRIDTERPTTKFDVSNLTIRDLMNIID